MNLSVSKHDIKLKKSIFYAIKRLNFSVSKSIRSFDFRLTHIGKLSGNDSGDFLETFSKKNILLYCDVTTDDN